jgi:hypothetical protein
VMDQQRQLNSTKAKKIKLIETKSYCFFIALLLYYLLH